MEDDLEMAVPALPEESVAQLGEVLGEWKLAYLLPQFIDEKIDLDVLKIIDISHINLLIHKYPIGVQIRFLHNLMSWRKSIGMPIKEDTFYDILKARSQKEFYAYSDALTAPRTDTNWMPKCNAGNVNEIDGNEKQTHKDTKEQSYLSTNKLQYSKTADLNCILMNSPPTGPDLIDLYKKRRYFTQHDRQRLMETIVNYFLRWKIIMNLQISYELENAIVKMFPTESFRKYRNSRYGKIYLLYLKEKSGQTESENYSDIKESQRNVEDNSDDDVSDSLMNDLFTNENVNDGPSVEKTSKDMDHDIFIQTICDGHKKFVGISPPFDYSDFLTSACLLFNIAKIDDYCVHTDGVEIDEINFKSIILRHYKSITFEVQLQQKSNSKDVNVHSDYLPDAQCIRNLRSLLPFVHLSDEGKPLENNHRTTIAKAIIEECLADNPERVLKRQDFLTLADNICKAFHTEVPSTYFVPCRDSQPARGKLMNAYNNKRYTLSALGQLERRPRQTNRKRYTYAKDQNDNEIERELQIMETAEFSVDTDLDIDQLCRRWRETHKQRRKQLTDGLKPAAYLTKYSVLKSIKGIDLVEIDVKLLYPQITNVGNWLTVYHKVVDKVRSIRNFKQIQRTIEEIDASKDTRYRASLALNLLVYIFPHTWRFSKAEVQQRFLKEYKSMEELKSAGAPPDLQLRFIHQCQQIVYADFCVCGFIYKCVDLLEALAYLFHYIMALDLSYPRMCLRIWQFIQLVIFNVKTNGVLLPQIECTINDLRLREKN